MEEVSIQCPSYCCLIGYDTGVLGEDGSYRCSHCGDSLTPQEFVAMLDEYIAKHETEATRLRELKGRLSK